MRSHRHPHPSPFWRSASERPTFWQQVLQFVHHLGQCLSNLREHLSHLGILLMCRFRFSRPRVEHGILHFQQSPRWCWCFGPQAVVTPALERTEYQLQPGDKGVELTPEAQERNPVLSLRAQSQNGVSYIVLSELSQTEKDKYFVILLICGI